MTTSLLKSDIYNKPLFNHLPNAIARSTRGKMVSKQTECVGVGGLSGLCLGFSVEVGRCLANGERNISVAMAFQNGANFSKLLLKSFWKLLPRNVSRDDVSLEKYAELVKTIEADFLKTIASRLQLQIHARIPGDSKTYFQMDKTSDMHQSLLSLAQKANDRASCILIIVSRKYLPMLDWHVLLIHPASRTIADARTHLITHGEETEMAFIDTVMCYLRVYYRKSDFHMLHVSLPNPGFVCKENSFIRLEDRLHTAFSIAKHSMPQAAFFLSQSLPKVDSAILKVAQKIDPRTFNQRNDKESIEADIEKLMQDALSDRVFEDFYFLVRSYLEFFPDLLQRKNFRLPCYPTTFRNNYDQVIALLYNIEKLGPKAEGILAQLVYDALQSILRRDNEGTDAISHLQSYMRFHQFLSKEHKFELAYFLRTLNSHLIHSKTKEERDLFMLYLKVFLEEGGGDVGDLPNLPKCGALFEACETGLLEAVKLYLEHGANPFSNHYKNATPLDIAKKKGHNQLVEYLKTFQNF